MENERTSTVADQELKERLLKIILETNRDAVRGNKVNDVAGINFILDVARQFFNFINKREV